MSCLTTLKVLQDLYKGPNFDTAMRHQALEIVLDVLWEMEIVLEWSKRTNRGRALWDMQTYRIDTSLHTPDAEMFLTGIMAIMDESHWVQIGPMIAERIEAQ